MQRVISSISALRRWAVRACSRRAATSGWAGSRAIRLSSALTTVSQSPSAAAVSALSYQGGDIALALCLFESGVDTRLTRVAGVQRLKPLHRLGPAFGENAPNALAQPGSANKSITR